MQGNPPGQSLSPPAACRRHHICRCAWTQPNWFDPIGPTFHTARGWFDPASTGSLRAAPVEVEAQACPSSCAWGPRASAWEATYLRLPRRARHWSTMSSVDPLEWLPWGQPWAWLACWGGSHDVNHDLGWSIAVATMRSTMNLVDPLEWLPRGQPWAWLTHCSGSHEVNHELGWLVGMVPTRSTLRLVGSLERLPQGQPWSTRFMVDLVGADCRPIDPVEPVELIYRPLGHLMQLIQLTQLTQLIQLIQLTCNWFNRLNRLNWINWISWPSGKSTGCGHTPIVGQLIQLNQLTWHGPLGPVDPVEPVESQLDQLDQVDQLGQLDRLGNLFNWIKWTQEFSLPRLPPHSIQRRKHKRTHIQEWKAAYANDGIEDETWV